MKSTTYAANHAEYMRDWRDLNEGRAREISQAANKKRTE